jgi:carbamoyl-phosphate synthase small subunit
MKSTTAVLVLQNGQVYHGQGFGTEGIRYGECVFTTGMTGYTESLTDPSYAGQILCFASPLIGNIGTSSRWYESERMYADGLIVSSLSEEEFHHQQNQSLSEFLIKNNRGGIQGIDTRRLVKTLRDQGNQPCILIVGEERIKMLQAMAFDLSQDITIKTFHELVGMIDNPEDVGFLDWANRVSKDRFETTEFNNNLLTDKDKITLFRGGTEADELANATIKTSQSEKKNNQVNKTIVVLDCGVKLNILLELSKRVKKLIVLPATSTCDEIIKYNPDGVLLSNGPGDPRDYSYAVETVKALLKHNTPIMGICLGHQLLSLAIGCNVYKMKFGNRGANQPVQDMITKRAYLTSQNHGYATDPSTIPNDFQIYFQNLNDQTIEGISHKSKPVFSFQFHPEACGGPQDTNWLFDKFNDYL